MSLLGRTRVDKNDKIFLANYKLESNYLAINSDRSQYILLTETLKLKIVFNQACKSVT